ncbi:MAG: NAD(P)-dependent oxidoreductase [Nocardioidaceae bacterium]
MRVAVTGATGLLGRSVLPSLIEAGHDVVALVRTPERAVLAQSMGADAQVGSLFDVGAFAELLDGFDVVCNLASHVPVNYAAAMPWVRRGSDALRTEGVRRILEAARKAGVRRVVQESASYLYADAGDDWINERSTLCINEVTEPISVGESLVQEFTCCSRTGVVLRFGALVEAQTSPQVRQRVGRVMALGAPDGWAHVVHASDVGPAVLAALDAPSGVYNVGAVPVRRSALAEGYAQAGGRRRRLAPALARLSGQRAEPLTRSLRVSSSAFHDHTGWEPRHAEFDASWLMAGSA